MTTEYLFYLGLAALAIYVALELRAQNIAKSLSGNLVTLYTRGQGVAESLVNVAAQQNLNNKQIFNLLKDSGVDRGRLIDIVNNDLHEIRQKIQEISDKEQQSSTVIMAKVVEKIDSLNQSIADKVREEVAAATPPNTGGTGFSLDQIMETIKNSGEALDKLGPITDFLNKVRNNNSSKN